VQSLLTQPTTPHTYTTPKTLRISANLKTQCDWGSPPLFTHGYATDNRWILHLPVSIHHSFNKVDTTNIDSKTDTEDYTNSIIAMINLNPSMFTWMPTTVDHHRAILVHWTFVTASRSQVVWQFLISLPHWTTCIAHQLYINRYRAQTCEEIKRAFASEILTKCSHYSIQTGGDTGHNYQ